MGDGVVSGTSTTHSAPQALFIGSLEVWNNKAEPYTKEPYPTRQSFVNEKNARQKPRKKGSEQSSPRSLNVCVRIFLILDIFY